MFDQRPSEPESCEPESCEPESCEPESCEPGLSEVALSDVALSDVALSDLALSEAGLFKTLRDTAVAAAEFDVTSCEAEELTDAFAALEAARRAIDATRSRIAAHLEATGATLTDDGLRTHNWLAWHHGLPRPEATTLVRTGQFLRTHPDVAAALAHGAITHAHVAFLDRCRTPRIAHTFDAVVDHLVDLAHGVRYETWTRDVRALLTYADPDGGHRPTIDDNRLHLTTDSNGTIHLRGELVGEWATELRAALAAEADHLFRTTQRDAHTTNDATPRPPRAQLLALALVDLIRRGRASRHTATAPLSDVTIVLTTPPTLPDPDLLHPEHPEHPDPEWLQRITAACLDAHTLDGNPLHPSTAALLTCDASYRILVETFTGETLALGRTQRLATPAQRRAALRRYGGCCFPGCDTPPNWTELHHTPNWDHGGTTDLPHLAPLCRHHHGLIHQPHWNLEPHPHHGFTITTPTGVRLIAQTHGRSRSRSPDPGTNPRTNPGTLRS
jgi:hypothetical protein